MRVTQTSFNFNFTCLKDKNNSSGIPELQQYPTILKLLQSLVHLRSVASVVSNSLWPQGLWPTRLLCHGILQARTMEWVAIPFSRGSSQPRDRTWVSCIGRGIPYHWLSRETKSSFTLELNPPVSPLHCVSRHHSWRTNHNHNLQFYVYHPHNSMTPTALLLPDPWTCYAPLPPPGTGNVLFPFTDSLLCIAALPQSPLPPLGSERQHHLL